MRFLGAEDSHWKWWDYSTFSFFLELFVAWRMWRLHSNEMSSIIPETVTKTVIISKAAHDFKNII